MLIFIRLDDGAVHRATRIHNRVDRDVWYPSVCPWPGNHAFPGGRRTVACTKQTYYIGFTKSKSHGAFHLAAIATTIMPVPCHYYEMRKYSRCDVIWCAGRDVACILSDYMMIMMIMWNYEDYYEYDDDGKCKSCQYDNSSKQYNVLELYKNILHW